MKGLIIDPEDYNYMLFQYLDQQVSRWTARLTTMSAIARQRGREVMAAIAAHMPAPSCSTLYGYTLPLSERRGDNTPQNIRYTLLPAFYDGLLEAMPVERTSSSMGMSQPMPLSSARSSSMGTAKSVREPLT